MPERSPQRLHKATTRTERVKSFAKLNSKKEEKHVRRSKRLQHASPEFRSPPAKTVKSVTQDIELDSITEDEEVADIADTENASERSEPNLSPQHVQVSQQAP